MSRIKHNKPEEDLATAPGPLNICLDITKDEINRLPLGRFEGTIHLITTPAAARAAVARLKEVEVLGFDTESRPAFRKGENYSPSIVQFATNYEAYLFQVKRFGGLELLKPLLESESPIKVGVALRDDIKRLQQVDRYDPAGFVEISEISRRLGIEKTGLRSLIGMFLGLRISKNAQVSNWARRTLNHKQIIYAATDAWMSRRLYMLVRKAEQEHLNSNNLNTDH
ncbi:3'-5' exonuclease [Cerasicoccus arenae]|uniref:3'-exoribonuclease n=1 Tax=Cerasicoccus arenae TaxID=424488 RepID=A0A8J3GC96_9BACT|nr:3'-5' exonuclease [Cerasicoccus arenae]MBK1858136.1 3'-5' exonuclease domain-containing protein 2 [Cerasicoccus arenae]GHB96715.1 3'-exoribonuclease [Cerasicoccus arenae]